MKASHKKQSRAYSIIGLHHITASISTSPGVSVLACKAASVTVNNTMQKDKDAPVPFIVSELQTRRGGRHSNFERVSTERAESQG